MLVEGVVARTPPGRPARSGLADLADRRGAASGGRPGDTRKHTAPRRCRPSATVRSRGWRPGPCARTRTSCRRGRDRGPSRRALASRPGDQPERPGPPEAIEVRWRDLIPDQPAFEEPARRAPPSRSAAGPAKRAHACCRSEHVLHVFREVRHSPGQGRVRSRLQRANPRRRLSNSTRQTIPTNACRQHLCGDASVDARRSDPTSSSRVLTLPRTWRIVAPVLQLMTPR